MINLSAKITTVIDLHGNIAEVDFRQPTVAEQNEHRAVILRIPDNAKPDHAVRVVQEENARYFDVLVIDVRDLSDDKGPLTVERKADIPAQFKSEVLSQAFPPLRVDVKN